MMKRQLVTAVIVTTAACLEFVAVVGMYWARTVVRGSGPGAVLRIESVLSDDFVVFVLPVGLSAVAIGWIISRRHAGATVFGFLIGVVVSALALWNAMFVSLNSWGS